MQQLPIFQQQSNQPLMMLQTRWASILNPVLSNPLTAPTILTNISLQTGTNVIDHKLGQTQQGWFITDIQGAASIYRSAAFNDKTLTLTSSAPVVISLGVF